MIGELIIMGRLGNDTKSNENTLFGVASQSSMHISPSIALTADVVRFRAIVGHEIIHTIHFYRFGASASRTASERVAYQFSFQTFKNVGRINEAMRIKRTAMNLREPSWSFLNFWGRYPSRYSISNYLFLR